MSSPALPDVLRAHLAVSFDLLHLLGEGGMGVVWLARDRLLDREVAIKALRSGSADDADGARRFLQEARLAARLQHPGVVPLLTFGEVGGHRYYVMPYTRGETLADRLRRGPLSEAETRRVVGEVADALAYVHTQGIVHRDVKPANILLDAITGRALLTDFGIARSGDSAKLTATGMIVGTPLYLAPEQATGGADLVDGRADIYALGVVAWEALAGVSPFADATPHEIVARKMIDGVPSVREPLPGVSMALSRCIDRATAKEPALRWASAAELAAAVRVEDDADPDPVDARPLRAQASAWLVAGTPILSVFFFLLDVLPTSVPLAVRFAAPVVSAAAVSVLLAFGRCASLRTEHAPQRSWKELLPIVMRPPQLWFAWWPRRWIGFDLADHVPDWLSRPMRRERLRGTVALLLGAAVGAWIALASEATGEEMVRSTWYFLGHRAMRGGWIVLPMLATVALSIRSYVAVRARLKKAGVSQQQQGFINLRQYDATIMREPFMRLIIGDAQAPMDMPADMPGFAASLAALAAQLRAAGWQLDDLAPVLDDVCAADAQWAREAEELMADAAPAEATRLRERLAKMRATASPAGRQDEMALLLERQLQLHERASARLLTVQSRRDRLRDGSALLWRQLRDLRADDARRAEPNELTGQLRAIASDLRRVREGADEADAVIDRDQNRSQ